MTATPQPRMTARDVRDALHGRWPDDQYLHVEEAPQNAMRQGRKLDVVVISLWRSRGHELDGVEIKVSYSDWKKEREDADKADWWWDHVHRFWVACPTELAMKIRDEVPTGWGLLAVSVVGEKTKVTEVVKPARHEAQPLPWTAVVGMMRAVSGCGANALARARDQGYGQGVEQGRKQAAREGSGAVQERYETLLANIKAFEEASGIDLRHHVFREEDGARLGKVVEAIRSYAWGMEPDKRLVNLSSQLRDEADRISKMADDLAAVFRTE